MIEDKAIRALRAEGYNCAQTVLAYAMRQHGRDAAPLLAALRGMGSGLCTGHDCGCIIGAVAAIGAAVPEDGLDGQRKVRAITQEMVRWFSETFGSLECARLKKGPNGAAPVPCDELIEKTCHKYTDIAVQNGIL